MTDVTAKGAKGREKHAAKMAINSILPYFGGKRTLAPRIVAELGDHRAYWELFCGSLAVLLAKPACRAETVNDLHGDVTNLARVIALGGHESDGQSGHARSGRRGGGAGDFVDQRTEFCGGGAGRVVLSTAQPTAEMKWNALCRCQACGRWSWLTVMIHEPNRGALIAVVCLNCNSLSCI